MTYETRGKQDGVTVFQVSGDDVNFVFNETKRYAYQYASEGPVIIEQKSGRRWKRVFEMEKKT